jgi:ureidoglycolate hydrolase
MIRAEELTAEAFRPFGRVIDAPERTPDAVDDPWRWWADTAVFDPAAGRYAVGYLEVSNGRTGFDWAERHLASEELVIPVRGELLLYAGPADQGDEPARERFRVFRVHPGQAALLGKGVWHGAPLAAGGEATALVLLLERTGATDTEIARFDEVPVEVQS